MGTFGEKLRKQREQRGLALDAVSNATKISTRMLRALEEEHFDQLPGGVFNKGFVRAYARQVGLNEEEAVSEYLEALRENQVQSQQILPDLRHPGTNSRAVTPHDSRHHILPAGNHPGTDPGNNRGEVATEDRRKQERRNELRRIHDRSGLSKESVPEAPNPQTKVPIETRRKDISLVQAELPAVRGDSKRAKDASHEREDFNTTDSPSGFITLGPTSESASELEEPEASSRFFLWSAAGAVLLLIAVSLGLWISRRHHDDVTAPAPSAAVIPTVSQPPAPAQPAGSAVATKTEPAPPVVKTPEKKADPGSALTQNKVSTAMPAKPTPAPSRSAESQSPPASVPPKPANTFTLQIRAEQTTWVSIAADGKPLIHETLIAPAHTSVRAAHDVSVKVGNAAGVSFQVNGKEFPAQGSPGEVRTYIFDASGLKPAQAMPQTPLQ